VPNPWVCSFACFGSKNSFFQKHVACCICLIKAVLLWNFEIILTNSRFLTPHTKFWKYKEGSSNLSQIWCQIVKFDSNLMSNFQNLTCLRGYADTLYKLYLCMFICCISWCDLYFLYPVYDIYYDILYTHDLYHIILYIWSILWYRIYIYMLYLIICVASYIFFCVNRY